MVARNIRATLRDEDTLCRWGGEEFIVLLPGVDRQALEAVAERVRRFVQSSWFDCGPDRIAVSVSIGATMIHAADTVDTMIERADRLMYHSKKNGRNCVTAG